MKIKTISITLVFVLFTFTSSLGQKVSSQDYSIELLKVDKWKNLLGGHKALFGVKKSEAETLYLIELEVKIEGLAKNKPIDFNLFSLVDHNHNTRHPLSSASFATFTRAFSVQKEKIEDNPNLEDTFLKFTLPDIRNYKKNKLESNAISFVTKNSKSYKYLFNLTVPNRALLRKKKISLFFYTKTEKIGDFSFYYKDNLIRKFTISKKNILKFKK